jgi:ribosomal protein L12E/L44/L45/RPP1/RPP2
MKKTPPSEIKRGQALSFRIPSDTPDHIVKHLQRLKETERRNFSSTIAEFVVQGISHSFSREKETITIPLPKKLTKAQKDWLKHEHSEAMLGSILYQLIADPIRATSLLASLNSNSLDIEEALYLQEEIRSASLTAATSKVDNPIERDTMEELAASIDDIDMDDDLSGFDWNTAKKPESLPGEEKVEEELDSDDLLGGFLANMNK